MWDLTSLFSVTLKVTQYYRMKENLGPLKICFVNTLIASQF